MLPEAWSRPQGQADVSPFMCLDTDPSLRTNVERVGKLWDTVSRSDGGECLFMSISHAKTTRILVECLPYCAHRHCQAKARGAHVKAKQTSTGASFLV